MLIIPTGLEKRPVLRLPVVTLALVGLNVAVAIVTTTVETARISDAALTFELVQTRLTERPFLAIPERLLAVASEEQLADLEKERALARVAAQVPPPEQRAAEQRDLEALVDDFLEALGRLPAHRFGFVATRPTWLTLLTHMFMHGGWLHLLGNMLLLYVSAPYVEDVYGRGLFALGYLASGLAAVGGQYLAAPASPVPLVGASGAIAGVMGMLLVRLWRTRIRFLFLPFVLPIVRIPLTLPAVVVLPLWLVEQLWYAQRASEGPGTAWWAHVSGFLFGCAFAAALKLMRAEERWLGSAYVSEHSRALTGVAVAREQGDLARAQAALGPILAAEPNNVAAWQEAYELALAAWDVPEVVRAMLRLLELHQQRHEGQMLSDLVEDERWQGLPDLPARLYLGVAGVHDRRGDVPQACAYYDRIVEMAPRDALALRALVKKGEALARAGQAGAARAALERAASHPACNEAWRTSIERVRAKVAGTSSENGAH